MYTRILTKEHLGDRAAESAEIERILTDLGYTYDAEPHPKGGLAVHIPDDQVEDLDTFLATTVAAGLLHVI